MSGDNSVPRNRYARAAQGRTFAFFKDRRSPRGGCRNFLREALLDAENDLSAVQTEDEIGYKEDNMAQNVNVRKLIATHVKNSAGVDLPEGLAIKADPSNPYAFVVEADGKVFRVIVKEIG